MEFDTFLGGLPFPSSSNQIGAALVLGFQGPLLRASASSSLHCQLKSPK